jgi:membrane-associated protein
VGIAIIIFVETGLLFGFVFPGDSLLIAAGMLAEEGYLDLRWLLVLATVAAITGDQVNYAIGLRLGNTLSKRYSQFSRYLTRAEVFYEKHGGKTIALVRFVPVLRTFAPAVAGAVKMNYRSFTGYNIVGGILWVFSMTLAGYSLGKIPDVEKYLLVIIVIVVIASLVPQIFEWRKMRNKGLEHDPKQ